MDHLFASDHEQPARLTSKRSFIVSLRTGSPTSDGAFSPLPVPRQDVVGETLAIPLLHPREIEGGRVG